jgi:glycosyltransferase involved in cell wall biosynthesis
MRAFRKMGIRTVFRGDSHLLDQTDRGPRWWLKHAVLKQVYSWPTGFLVVGQANAAYYRAFGVEANRLLPCTHSIDVARFAEQAQQREQEAIAWRRQLGISKDKVVLLFSAKLEPKKRPLQLMEAIRSLGDPRYVLVMVGSGELAEGVNSLANADPTRFRVLPFQNQSRMPVVYRLGDLFILPSQFGETWGLAVNEALACGRPVLVSDRVGCAADVVDRSCGRIFSWSDTASLATALREMTKTRNSLSEMGQNAAKRAWSFDISRTEAALTSSLNILLPAP